MATMKQAQLWRDPKTGAWGLRRRVPTKYLKVADQRGGIVKLTTGTPDRATAQQRWPAILEQWNRLVAEWDAALAEAEGRMFMQPLPDAWIARFSAPPHILARAALRKPQAPAVTLDDLFAAWRSTAGVTPDHARETGAVIASLKAHVGHDDAARITRADVVAWRRTMEGKIEPRTINNKLAKLSVVFDRAVNDDVLPSSPIDTKLRLPPNKVRDVPGYTDEQTATLLRAARTETAPHLRWGAWVQCFTGCRVSEVLQLRGCDVRQDGSIWYISVNTEDGKRTKTGATHNVPVHPALLAEGFVEFAATAAPAAPLFPGATGYRGKEVAAWARQYVSDPAIKPNHSWRHRLTTKLRAAGVVLSDREAIIGHSEKGAGGGYGVRGEALWKLHELLSRVPVPAGV